MSELVSGPKHRLESPVGDRPWSVVPTLLPPRPPRRVLRTAGVVLLEVFIWAFGSDDWRAR